MSLTSDHTTSSEHYPLVMNFPELEFISVNGKRYDIIGKMTLTNFGTVFLADDPKEDQDEGIPTFTMIYQDHSQILVSSGYKTIDSLLGMMRHIHDARTEEIKKAITTGARDLVRIS